MVVGACGRVPGWLVSHFFSLVSQAGCLWSGSRLACLPLLFTCLPGWVLVVGFPAGLSGSVLVVGFPAGLSPTSFHLSPTSFQAGRFWSGSRLACLPLPFVCLPLLFICLPLLFICLPGWVLVVGFPAGLSPTSFHVSPTFSPSSLLLGVLNSFLRCVRPLCHCWCPPISTSISIHLSPRSAASLAKHDPNPQAGVAILIPPGWVLTVEKTLVNHFAIAACVCYQACSIWLISLSVLTTAEPFSADHAAFLFICLPGLLLLVSALFRWPCSISIHLSPRSVIGGVRPFPLAMQHFYSCVSQACHCWCPPFSAGHVALLFICLPGLSLLVYSSPRSVTGGVRGHIALLFFCFPGLSLVCPCLMAMKHFYSFVSQVCHCWCPPFSAGDATFLFVCLPGLSALFCRQCSSLFICLPGLSLLVSALFRWPCSTSILLSPRSVTGVSLSIGHEAFLFICLPGPSLLVPCSISIHLSFRSVTGGVRPCPLAMKHFYSFVSEVRYCWCPPFSVGHVAFLFICLPCDFCLFVFQVWCLHCCFLPRSCHTV